MQIETKLRCLPVANFSNHQEWIIYKYYNLEVICSSISPCVVETSYLQPLHQANIPDLFPHQTSFDLQTPVKTPDNNQANSRIVWNWALLYFVTVK